MPKFSTIDIQIVPKTKTDLKNVINYMNKNKNNDKSK